MNAPALEDVAEQLLSRAKHHGATAADVVVVEGDELDVGVRLGQVEKVKRARRKHLGLRVFIGARSALTSSADFSHDAIERLAADACALAGVTAPDPFAGLPERAELAEQIPDLGLFDGAIEGVTPERALAWAKEAEAAALAADPRITNSEGAEVGAGSDRVVYASSHGFAGGYRDSLVSLSVVPVAADGSGMQRDYWYSVRRRLDRLDPPAEVGRTAAARALRRLHARPVRTCEVPVVFDAETASGLLRHLAAAVSGYALYKGTSFLIGKLGERIAPDGVTITDDGTLRGALGSKPFDGEGVPTRRTAVVERGILTSYLFDSYAGRKLGSRSTGNATRGVGSPPQVAPTNLILQPGTASPQEIIASVKQGLYVTELIGFGVNAVTGDYSRGAVGQWIENGECAFPVEEITIAGNLLEMYAAIEAVGNDLSPQHAVSAPTLRIARMTVAGR